MFSKCQASTDGYGFYTLNSAEPSRPPCQMGYKWQCIFFSGCDQIPDKRQLKSYFCSQLTKRLNPSQQGRPGWSHCVCCQKANRQEVRLAHKTSKLWPQFLRQSFTSWRIQNLTKQHYHFEANCPNRRLRATFHIQIVNAILSVAGSRRALFFSPSLIFIFCATILLGLYFQSLLSSFHYSSSKHFLSLFFSVPNSKQHPKRFSIAPLPVYLEGFELSPWKVL